MTHDYIDQLKQDVAELRVVRACNTCRHRPPHIGAYGAICRASGEWISLERADDDYLCGMAGRMWELKPPSFWSRLGDAIIDRVKGK